MKVSEMVQANASADASFEKFNVRSEWLPIETAPKADQWFKNGGKFLLAKFWQREDESGAPDGDPEIIWSAVVYLTQSGWRLPTNSIAATHGHASFPVRDDPTHWMPLPAPPTSSLNFSNDAESDAVSLNQPSTPSASTLAKEQEQSDAHLR